MDSGFLFSLSELLEVSDQAIFKTLNKSYCSDPTCGGRKYILKWDFLFSQFWPIDVFIVEKCEWYQ